MKAKKLLSIFLIGVSAVSLLAGCSSGNSSQESASVDTAQADTQEDASEETDQSGTQEAAGEDTEEAAGEEGQETESSGTVDGNVLVVYYSATGNTEGVANTIADSTVGDLFELKPVEPYTDEDLNYSDENSRVSREHEDESLRNVELTSTTVDNWDSYDTVFIGYPIWWNQAPRIINTFIESANWEGKILIPFATSGGSGIENSVKMLRKTYPKLNWKDGKLLNRADKEILQKWVDTFELKESFSQK